MVAPLTVADERGLRLSASPFTFLGEAQQTVFKALREGAIGKPLVAYSEMNWGRIEVWHGNAAAFYRKGVGPLLDVGVYALTVLTTAFGSVRRVTGFGTIQQPFRTLGAGPNAGAKFAVALRLWPAPTATGASIRPTMSPAMRPRTWVM